MIKALLKLVGETAYDVTMVEVDSDRKFLILGQTTVFFVDNSLRMTGSGSEDFAYSEIEDVSYYNPFPSFFKLKLRNERMPRPFVCEDAKSLINSLKCYWQIDYMNRTLSYRELRIHISNSPPKDAEDIQQMLIGTNNSGSTKPPSEPNFSYH